MAKKVKSATLGGVRIKIHTEPIVGYCVKDTEIYLDRSKPDEELFAASFHEAIHQEFPELPEDRVAAADRNVCRLLLRFFDVKKKTGAW